MAALHAVATERDPPGGQWGEASRRAADGGRRWNAAPTKGGWSRSGTPSTEGRAGESLCVCDSCNQGVRPCDGLVYRWQDGKIAFLRGIDFRPVLVLCHRWRPGLLPPVSEKLTADFPRQLSFVNS